MRANTICKVSLLCIIIISYELTATTTPKMFNVNCIAIKAPRLIGVLVSADQTGTMAFLYVIHHQYIIEHDVVALNLQVACRNTSNDTRANHPFYILSTCL